MIVYSLQRIDQHVTSVPQLAGVANGDVVSLSDDASVTGSIWQGSYVFHPAGSIVPDAPMYLRWKDGVVVVTPTPNPIAGQPPLSTFLVTYNETNGTDLYGNRSPMPYQVTKQLVADSSDASVLRIPDNAWLFRRNSDGQLTALVDAFVFQSGDQPIPMQNYVPGLAFPAAAGSQPVPVSVNAVSN